MSTIIAAVRLVLRDLARLETPAIAAGIAGVAAPVIAAVLGLNITAVEIAGWLAAVGSIAATLQKLSSGAAAKAVAKK